MADSVRARIPVVAGVAYIERVRQLPQSCIATLAVEPENRYFRHAIAVMVNGGKVGYVAPEIAAGIFDAVQASAEPISCPARRAGKSDHETSGVEILLDFSGLPIPLEA
jgi:hypothetical protein